MSAKRIVVFLSILVASVLVAILVLGGFGSEVRQGACPQLGVFGYQTITIGATAKEYCVRVPVGRVLATAAWGSDEAGFAVAFVPQPTPTVEFVDQMGPSSEGYEWYSVWLQPLEMRRLSIADGQFIKLSPDGSLASVPFEKTPEIQTFRVVDTQTNEQRCTYSVKGMWFDSGCGTAEQANGTTWEIQKENDRFYCGWFHGEMFADDPHCAEFLTNELTP